MIGLRRVTLANLKAEDPEGVRVLGKAVVLGLSQARYVPNSGWLQTPLSILGRGRQGYLEARPAMDHRSFPKLQA